MPERAADYVPLANDVLWQPPIRHRHTSYWKRHLKPFDFYVLAGILIAAKDALTSVSHAQALEGGAAAIKEEVRTSRQFFKSKEFRESHGIRGPKKGETIKRAGAEGYKKRRRALQTRTPEVVVVEISRRRLLRAASLSADAENFRAVEAALNRLCRPVGAGGCEMPAPLRDQEELPGGKLRLHVDGAWLPARRFKRLAWPPPKRSPAALAFYLLVHVLDTRPTNNVEVSAVTFAARLGLDPGAETGARNRAINAAFAVVNAHLRDLPDAQIARLWRLRRSLVPPGGLACEPLTDGKIRVVAVPRQKTYFAAEATTRPVGRRRSIKRVHSWRLDAGDLASDRQESAGVFASERDEVQGSSHRGAGVLASADRRESHEPQGFSVDLRGPYENECKRKTLVGEEE